ncbi:MAG: DMT family transporter [Patescibacteria group bacterium]
MSSRTKALIAIVATSLLWSTAGVAKIVVRVMDPFTTAFLRFALASLIILPFFLKEKRRPQTWLRDLGILSLGSAANVGLFYLGIRTSTANAATIIYAGVPLVTLILARRLIGEVVTIKKLVGIIVGLVGVLTIAVLPTLERGEVLSGDFRGNLFYLAAVIIWSLYTVGSRHAMAVRGYSPITVSAVSIFVPAAVFAPLIPFTFRPGYFAILTQPIILLLIFHLAIVVTVFTYLLFQWAIQNSSATTASLKQYLEPVFSILFNVTFLGESLTRGFLLGTLLVFTGVAIASGANLVAELKRIIVKQGK